MWQFERDIGLDRRELSAERQAIKSRAQVLTDLAADLAVVSFIRLFEGTTPRGGVPT